MVKDSLSFIERRVIMPIISQLTIPKHVGFIMDGNRRFAKTLNAPATTGHRMGFDSLSSVLLWCFELGVSEVSVYAFSVDNFSRPSQEVDYLMDLAVEKLSLMCKPESFMMRNQIRVKVCGDISLLPLALREVISRIEKLTSDHTNGKFNIMFAYSSKRELTHAIEAASNNCKSVTWNGIESNLYNNTPLDLLVRTSGETRLSDFMIWQIQPLRTLIVFEKGLWPRYNLRSLIMSLLRYNAHATLSRN